MKTFKFANALGKNIKKYSITSFSIEEEKHTTSLFLCMIDEGNIKITGEVEGNHTHYIISKNSPFTDKDKKTVEDFVWDLKCDLEQLSNRYNYSYEIEWR